MSKWQSSKAVVGITIIIAVTIWATRLFSPTEPVLISCLELQGELNRLDPKLKLAEDGVCGPATMSAWNEVVFNRYSLELWPEKVGIVE